MYEILNDTRFVFICITILQITENKIVTSKFFQNDIYIKPANIVNVAELVKDVGETEAKVEQEESQGIQIQKNEDKIKVSYQYLFLCWLAPHRNLQCRCLVV